jgi:hypothetical protein
MCRRSRRWGESATKLRCWRRQEQRSGKERATCFVFARAGGERERRRTSSSSLREAAVLVVLLTTSLLGHGERRPDSHPSLLLLQVSSKQAWPSQPLPCPDPSWPSSSPCTYRAPSPAPASAGTCLLYAPCRPTLWLLTSPPPCPPLQLRCHLAELPSRRCLLCVVRGPRRRPLLGRAGLQGRPHVHHHPRLPPRLPSAPEGRVHRRPRSCQLEGGWAGLGSSQQQCPSIDSSHRYRLGILGVEDRVEQVGGVA